jgi:hypothetical protein
MRKTTKIAASLAIVGAAAAAPSAAMAQTSSPHATPKTYSTCDVETLATLCFLITGTGDSVGYMQDTVTWTSSRPNTHLEINGPGGTWNSKAGTSVSSFRETFNRTVTPGSYCGTAWYFSGDYHQAAQSCVTVNS